MKILKVDRLDSTRARERAANPACFERYNYLMLTKWTGLRVKKNVKKSEALLEENTTVMSVNLFIVSW